MPKRDDVTVKLDKEVVRKARIVAAYRDITLAEYFSEKLAPLVDADLAHHSREYGDGHEKKAK